MSTDEIDDDTGAEADPIESPPIGAEFRSGSVDAGLESLRARLLDLTGRNRLLNFRHSPKSTLRFVHAPIDGAFERLMDGDRLVIEEVPEPPVVRDTRPLLDGGQAVPAKPAAIEFAGSLGWSTSYDLVDGEGPAGMTLRTPHYADALGAICRRIDSAARTAIEESGTNMLYLTFGFLEWYESDDSSEPRLAPLVTVPVTLSRSATRDGAASLEHSGDDIAPNLSLVERMRRDFGIEVPFLDDEEPLPAFFARIEHAVRRKARWRVRRQITLSLLSFGKLLMYRDLDPEVWPQIRTHVIVRELFEGRKADVLIHAPEYHFDDERRPPPAEAPEVVLDADSSQLSALVDALDGKNLVIEGPPGTGKSQTISNLVAAALERGKTVLFVSEKLAALEVVRRRLDEAGLGMFCLELHSHKTRKDALLRDLEARIDATGTFDAPEQIAGRIQKRQRTKASLRRYARLLQHRHEPLNCSLFQLVWRRERLSQSMGQRAGQVEALPMPQSQSLQREDLDRIDSELSVYSRHFESLHGRWSPLSDHPWSWVSTPLTFEGMTRLSTALRGVVGAATKALDVCAVLKESCGLELGETLDQISQSLTRLSQLPSPGSQVDSAMLEACRDANVRSALQALIVDVGEVRRTRQTLADHTVDHGHAFLTGRATHSGVQAALEVLAQFGLAGGRQDDVDAHIAMLKAWEAALREAVEAYARIAHVLEWSQQCSGKSARASLTCLGLAQRAPLGDLELRSPVFETAGIEAVIAEAALRAVKIKEEAARLAVRFDMGLAASTGPLVLRTYAQTLASATLWQRWFGRPYKEARAFWRLMSTGAVRAHGAAMARELLAVATSIEDQIAFNSDSKYQSALKELFKGLGTDWSALGRVAAWYALVADRVLELDQFAETVKATLFSSPADVLRRIVRQAGAVQADCACLERLPALLDELPASAQASADPLLLDLERVLAARREEISAAASVFRELCLKPTVTLDAVPRLVVIAQEHKAAQARCRANATALAAIGSPVSLEEINVDIIGATVAFAAEIAGGGWPERFCQLILAPDCFEQLARLRALVAEGQRAVTDLRDFGATVESLSKSDDWTLATSRPNSLLSRANRSLQAGDDLVEWNHWLTARGALSSEGLDSLISVFERHEAPLQELMTAFHLMYRSNLARAIFAELGDSALLSGLSQEEMRGQFRAADKEVISLSRARAAARIAERSVPQGNRTGPIKTWTDLALISNEVSKQKRHIPIRQLVKRAGGALQGLKPCFLMGPLSVAQYLTPGGLSFDLVVMDEASQLKPEDAVGAIARGGQIVVVGDPKQLPPTNFFQRVLREDDEDDDERAVVTEGESILDVASTLYQPMRRLRWHYRSRHQSLIAFSNREFYQGKLLVCPSSYETHPELGVRYRAVRGAYQNRRNEPEANAVVTAAIEHMRSRSGESLGVVALNFEQAQLLEEMFEERIRLEPEAQAFLERMREGAEPFFMKNLENVQGDERDVIFISCTYGPDINGNQFQRFGPITGADGHRRLNVLFTRAKRRVEVFSSLNPDKIHEHQASWGVRVFKQYLNYARTGTLGEATVGGLGPESDFEQSVGALLRQLGHHVAPQVGVAGFRIDIGVRNPARPGAFVLGIECDGAAYHSGRSARDRDRLRQEILENQGWKIHRIWSTDWFHSREREVDRLMNRVNQALESDADYREWRARETRREAVLGKLVVLQEDLAREFPETPPERALLRSEMFELFMAKRPVRQEDWFRFPLPLRERTDPVQIREYLSQIFAIFREAAE